MALTPGLIIIGVVRSAHTEPAATPVQSGLNPDETAVVEIDERYVDGLDGLAEFDFAWLLTWLERPDDSHETVALRQVPYLLGARPRKIGIFATRGPRRVNPIGLSLIKVLGVVGSTVRFSGVDVVDGTPVIDLKPYVTAFDRPPITPRCGWFDQVALPMGATPESLGRPSI
jgi:tRNA-Thr(GGU) m(6)t(6)A37 methyltransferase TsaA